MEDEADTQMNSMEGEDDNNTEIWKIKVKNHMKSMEDEADNQMNNMEGEDKNLTEIWKIKVTLIRRVWKMKRTIK